MSTTSTDTKKEETKKESGTKFWGELFGAILTGIAAGAEASATRRKNEGAMVRFKLANSFDRHACIRLSRIEKIDVEDLWSRATLTLDSGERIRIEFEDREKEILAGAGFYV